jgi:GT2 family glycosyltransferase
MTMVSVVIPSWNTRELLRNCLESLKLNLPHSSEVIVVDNGSHDGSARLVAEQFQHVRLIRNQRNTGFAHATNQGVEAARGAYVLFLSTDTVVTGNAVKLMLAFLEQNLRYGAAAPQLVHPDGAVQRSHMRFPTLATPLWVGTPLERWFPKNKEIQRYFARDFDYDLDSDVEHPPATCLLMRRKALKKSKPLDENLWLFFNDVDLCRRLWQAGWRIAYLAGAKVVHYGAMSTRQFANFAPEWHKNRLAYYRKHYGRVGGWFVKACVGWTFADHCVREFWRRAHGLDEKSLLPAWHTFSVFWKH